MKNVTLVLLCCSSFLSACDSSKVAETKDMPSSVTTKTGDVVVSNDDARQGESIYNSRCNACHGTGAAGAPMLGDKVAWSARIAQGNTLLLQHAVEGFKGDTGYMPPKGGFLGLSDEEVSLAVQYMVSQSQ